MHVSVPSILGRVRKFTPTGKLRGKDLLVVSYHLSPLSPVVVTVSLLAPPLSMRGLFNQWISEEVIPSIHRDTVSSLSEEEVSQSIDC